TRFSEFLTTGKGRKNSALTMLNTPELAPIPRAKERMATIENSRFFNKRRKPKRRSLDQFIITIPLAAHTADAATGPGPPRPARVSLIRLHSGQTKRIRTSNDIAKPSRMTTPWIFRHNG